MGFETNDSPRIGTASPPELVDWFGEPGKSETPAQDRDEATGKNTSEATGKNTNEVTGKNRSDVPDTKTEEGEGAAQDGGRSIGEYPLHEFADGWKTFLTREEIPEGQFFDLLNEFGREQILGKFDAKRIAEMMNAVEPTSQEELDDVLGYFNKNMAENGLKLDIKLDDAGKITSLNLRETNPANEWNTGFIMNAKGEMRPYSMRVNLDAAEGPLEQRPITADAASLLLAKKMSPLACP